MELRSGETIDAYRLICELGSGGQADVWRAVDAHDGRTEVALKLVDVASARPVDVERLRREAYALARLEHPSLVRCLRLFEDPRRAVMGLVLELVDGAPLTEVERDPRFDRSHRLWVLRHVAAALRGVHAAGLSHRDVKPANVIVRRDFFDHPEAAGTVKLIDLGIATTAGNPQPLTAPEKVIGTKEYLAPELLAPAAFGSPTAGPERDSFAFGVLAMRLLVGRHPSGLGPGATIAEYRDAYVAHARSGAPFPVGVDDEREAPLYRRALALRPADRARDGAALVALLEPTLVELAPLGTVPFTAPPAAPSAIAPTVVGTPDASTPGPYLPPAPPRAPRARRRAVAIGVSAALALALAMSATLLWILAPPKPPARGQGPSPTSVALAAPPRPTAVAAATAPLDCPSSMVEVHAGGASCVDRRPVTVAQFVSKGGHLAGDADWPGAPPSARAEQSARCRTLGPSQRDLAVNCVDLPSAQAFCERSGKRLARGAEWRGALDVGAVRGAGPTGALYEWTADRSDRGPRYRVTCGGTSGTCDGSNPETARNDDCGFRCAFDPR